MRSENMLKADFKFVAPHEILTTVMTRIVVDKSTDHANRI